MPELPEVETVMRGLEPVLAHVRIIKVKQNRPDLRFPFPKDFVKRVQGKKVGALSRRAKYLLVPLESGENLVVHLGMSGRITIQKSNEDDLTDLPNPAHDHVVFTLENGAIIRYNDPRRFGFMTLVGDDEMEHHKLFASLGPEPLGNQFHAKHLAQVARNRQAPLKNFLLNQKTVAGLGNIYVCEALYRAGLSPLKKAQGLTRQNGTPTKATERLVAAIKQVLQEAIEQGGSTLRDHRLTDGTLGYFQHSFAVYGREGAHCRTDKCKGTINRLVQAGRSTFYCPDCQK
ncbi:MAG: bifunctional DNA-formamidopyrimidine glycosylase/DNA-(apurinic or apyrimidinic site) lyase [Hyphomicrobiaceae bacterium]|nr:bifunctional DNA-formamidopyrimidine glycosylase/DNA-(apurinic or apyrimidinic site) lyase [Hyphomicrobiaceae bacterium]